MFSSAKHNRHGSAPAARFTSAASLLLIAIGAGAHAAVAGEPCEPHWDAALGQPGVSDIVTALAVHDGDLIAAGWFATAGGQTVNRIARWDGSAWHPLVSGGQIGVSGDDDFTAVHSLTVYNGDLIVGGFFSTAGGQAVNNIVRCDGSAWHPLISGGQIGVSSRVLAMTVHNDELIVGGEFLTAGGQIGVIGSILALTAHNANLIAGGPATAGGQTVNNIARWDGSAWHPFISASQIGVSDLVTALALYNGDVIAAGWFAIAGGQAVNRIAAWSGCPLPGACCVNGVAVQLTIEECVALGGVFHGEGVPSSEVKCDPSCPADINASGAVDVDDLIAVILGWGVCP